MSDFISDLLGNLSGGATEKISSTLGVDQSVINQIIPVLAPMILGGLKNQSANNGGQERVDHILNKYGDPESVVTVCNAVRYAKAPPGEGLFLWPSWA